MHRYPNAPRVHPVNPNCWKVSAMFDIVVHYFMRDTQRYLAVQDPVEILSQLVMAQVSHVTIVCNVE